MKFLYFLFLKEKDKRILMKLLFHFPEYCHKYAKAEDVAAAAEEKSSDEELSEDDYGASSDEGKADQADP